MKLVHTEEGMNLAVKLVPFCTIILFQPDEMDLAELVIRRILELDLSDEHRQQLTNILNQVRAPYDKTEVN